MNDPKAIHWWRDSCHAANPGSLEDTGPNVVYTRGQACTRLRVGCKHALRVA